MSVQEVYRGLPSWAHTPTDLDRLKAILRGAYPENAFLVGVKGGGPDLSVAFRQHLEMAFTGFLADMGVTATVTVTVYVDEAERSRMALAGLIHERTSCEPTTVVGRR